ncbi:MAG: hypothetical protein ACE5H9_12560 [Anaerolineae bacterium]
MFYISLAVAVIALVMAWGSRRTIKDLKERNYQLNSKIYRVKAEMLERAEAHQRELAGLKFELMRRVGELKVTGDMTIDEIAMLHPQATQVLAGFHIGGCASCAVDGSQRLADVVEMNDHEIEPILVALNTLLAEGGDETLSPGRFKTPNVELMA